MLYLAGGTIGLVSLQLPHPTHADLSGLYSNVALAFLGGAGLLAAASRLRPWMLQVTLAAGSLIIARAIVLSGEASSFYSVWFIWVALYAFYFFNRRVAVCHVAFVAVLYAATLANNPPTSPVASWLTTVATLGVAGIFTDTLVGRARREASAAAESANTMAQVTELAHELAALTEPVAVRLAVCQGAVRVTRACRAFLWEPSTDRRRLTVTAGTSGSNQNAVPFAGLSPGLSEAFATGAPVTRCMGPNESHDSSVAWLWHPIKHDETTVAILELSWDDPVAPQDPSIVALTELLAVGLAVTLERVQLLGELEAIARTDELTALPNRRAWHEQLARELTRAARSERPLSVAMLDLDHFKRYNDSRGHPTGDRLLKGVAASWLAELRPTDILARYGGEEFALALPECPLDEALEVVERLRAAVPDDQSCSAGLATWDGTETAAELLDRADHALYRAKRGGRNRSALAGSPVASAAAG
jgi:diguanylate cyclase (GGDEF)-like protein